MHKIFLIHGMGNWMPGWSARIQKAILGDYDPQKYAFLSKWPFASQFEFVEINYNNLFQEYLDEAKKRADQLGSWSKLTHSIDGAVFDLMTRVVKAASTPPSNKFLATHIGDAAFFLGTDIGELVKSSVALQIAKALEPPFEPAKDSWSIIAHSLGTRVATEVLQAGFTTAPSLRSFGKAKVVFMAANVSRLLQGPSPFKTGDVYHNAVYPADKAGAGVCEQFINATHRLDPFAFIKEFDPPTGFGNGQVFTDDVYHGIKLNAADITSKDLHDLEHYLKHPAVHCALFQYLIPGSGQRAATASEMNSAMAAYRADTMTAEISTVWRESLTNLKEQPFESVSQIFDIWEKYGELIA